MGLSDLIRSLDELRVLSDACNRCGMCQAVCPVFRETGREGDVARGKLALIDGLRREILHRPDRVMERLNRCLLCGQCERVCSRKVKLIDLFIMSRIIITDYSGLPSFKKLIFRFVLRYPKVFDDLTRLVSKLQRTFPGTGSTGTFFNKITHKITHKIPFLKQRHIIPLAARSFRHKINEHNTVIETKKTATDSILFFTGCLIDKMMPNVAEACVRVLQRVNVETTFLPDESCCGIPSLASGDRLGFSRLLDQNLNGIKAGSFDILVTACATCTMVIRDIWPGFCSKGNHHTARNLADHTMDINDFVLTRTDLPRILDELKTRPTSSKPKTITFHEPCHLRKGGAPSGIRAILKNLPGYRYVEMTDSCACCGMGGSFNITHYDLSRRIGEKKAKSIAESGADIVLTACPACMMQLTDMIHQSGLKVGVRHVMEILSDVLAQYP